MSQCGGEAVCFDWGFDATFFTWTLPSKVMTPQKKLPKGFPDIKQPVWSLGDSLFGGKCPIDSP
nr:hypothetical protein [Nostoc sp. EkiNYC01]